MKIFSIIFLYSLFIPIIYAEADKIQLLQQRASFAYEQMMEAKKEADYLAKDAAFAEKELQVARDRLDDIERNTEEARQKSAEAKQALQQATREWEEASDILEQEWKQSGRH